MRTFDKQEAWELKPRGLTIEETEHPEYIVKDLFEYASLPQLRWQLWEAAKTLIAGDFHRLKSKERNGLIYFYEQMERLIEATHIMHERSKLKNCS